MSDEQVGYTSDGLVWMSYIMEHEGVPMKATLIFPADKAENVGNALIGAAGKAREKLVEMGVMIDVGDSANTH